MYNKFSTKYTKQTPTFAQYLNKNNIFLYKYYEFIYLCIHLIHIHKNKSWPYLSNDQIDENNDETQDDPAINVILQFIFANFNSHFIARSINWWITDAYINCVKIVVSEWVTIKNAKKIMTKNLRWSQKNVDYVSEMGTLRREIIKI